ncbi:MAG: A/G-specific adenine glycosylase [Flavobacteriaceae bacterium]
MNFSQKLISWYLQNKRDLPWRETKNPYKIWLSEVILQQTRVAQGLPYYKNFVKKFPTVFDLAQADEEQVLKTWQGLGYYSRARNLHHTSKHISENLNGNFPENYNDLLKLKGIGSYTAAAIASFSYQEPVAVLDGNVYRVLSRYFGIQTDISSSKAKKEFQELANRVLDKKQPSLFNQAIMEFGALQCVPKNPNCKACIFKNSCFALQKNKVAQLPIKLKKTKITQRFLNYLVFMDENENTIINKRTQNGIWKNLYEFPLLEVTEKTDLEVITQKISEMYSDQYTIKDISVFNPKEIVHKLSHQQLYILFWKISVRGNLNKSIALSEISGYPFPIVIYNFIANLSK